MKHLYTFENYNSPRKLYTKDQPQLFDIGITEDDYERLESTNGKKKELYIQSLIIHLLSTL